jgi:mycoredoxin
VGGTARVARYRRCVLRSWRLPLVLWACGVGVTIALADRDPVVAVAELVFFTVLGAVLSPLVFPRGTTAHEAQGSTARDGRPVVYWRPGCRYCLRLRLVLGRASQHATWVNIWQDPAGAAAVRAVTGGDETVPTVVTHEGAVVNPDPRRLRERLVAA